MIVGAPVRGCLGRSAGSWMAADDTDLPVKPFQCQRPSSPNLHTPKWPKDQPPAPPKRWRKRDIHLRAARRKKDEVMTKRSWIGAVVLGASLFSVPMRGYAQVVDIGKREYHNSCAVCHGVTGKGDGPLAAQLKKPVADLTKIEESNKGMLPVDRIFAVIDGRQAVEAHGPRDMPLWGNVFSSDVAAGLCFGWATPKELDSLVQGRILALIGYIHTLQAK